MTRKKRRNNEGVDMTTTERTKPIPKALQKKRVHLMLRHALGCIEQAMKPTYRVEGMKLLKMFKHEIHFAELTTHTAQYLNRTVNQKELETAVGELVRSQGIVFSKRFRLNKQMFREMAKESSIGVEFFSAHFMEMFDSRRKGMSMQEISDTYRYKVDYVKKIIEGPMEILLIKQK